MIQLSERIQALLGSLGQGTDFGGPGEALCDVNTKELGALHSLQHSTVDADCGAVSSGLSEINKHLFSIHTKEE